MARTSGEVIAGRYRLDRLLGQGGMGQVWSATHTVTRRRVALKFLRGAADPSSTRRFLREARAASAVEHPNVVAIHDLFALDDGTPLMVMDLLVGETLGDRLRREQVLSLSEVTRLISQVVSAVGSAHELGIVHRDLKPDNVFLTESGDVKVLDFGIAKLFAPGEPHTAETETADGVAVGTPCYMAPEQSFGEREIDHRADIWALGAMLYEALSGGRPVEGENVGQVVKRLLEDRITPIEALIPDLPGDLSRMIGRMLERKRDDRPSDLREVAATLASHTDIEVPVIGAWQSRELPPVDAGQADPTPPRQTPLAAPASAGSRRRATVRALLVAVAIAGIAALGLLYEGRHRGSAPMASEPEIGPGAPVGSREPEPPIVSAAAGAESPPLLERTLEASSKRPAPTRKPEPPTGAAPHTSSASPSPVPEPSTPLPAPTKTTKPSGLVEEPPF
jgi:eukaryotic-like serine/threonine-protein kinase